MGFLECFQISIPFSTIKSLKNKKRVPLTFKALRITKIGKIIGIYVDGQS